MATRSARSRTSSSIRQTGEPEWATVKTGLFGLKSTFVPTREAQVTGDDQVRVPFQKDQVKNAPTIDADGQLSPEQERELWELLRRGIVGRRSRECGYDA